MANTASLAVFAKTPGLSPVKTRLARDIGQNAAEDLYREFCACLQQVVDQVPGGILTSRVWAVAEREAMGRPLPTGWTAQWQGEGGLGDRLSHVYGNLIEKNSRVCIIGSDSPHIEPEWIADSCEKLQGKADFVIGDALDGGFWILGGRTPIPPEVFRQVNYSADTTGAEMRRQLEKLGNVVNVRTTFDVDTLNDLKVLEKTLAANAKILPQQEILLEKLRGLAR